MLLPIPIESWSVARLLPIDGRVSLLFVTCFERVFVCLPYRVRFVAVLFLVGLVLRVHVASYSAIRNPLATVLTPLLFNARSLIFLRSSSVRTVPVTLTSPWLTM